MNDTENKKTEVPVEMNALPAPSVFNRNLNEETIHTDASASTLAEFLIHQDEYVERMKERQDFAGEKEEEHKIEGDNNKKEEEKQTESEKDKDKKEEEKIQVEGDNEKTDKKQGEDKIEDINVKDDTMIDDLLFTQLSEENRKYYNNFKNNQYPIKEGEPELITYDELINTIPPSTTDKAEEEKKKNQKMCKTLGVVSGLVFCIILF